MRNFQNKNFLLSCCLGSTDPLTCFSHLKTVWLASSVCFVWGKLLRTCNAWKLCTDAWCTNLIIDARAVKMFPKSNVLTLKFFWFKKQWYQVTELSYLIWNNVCTNIVKLIFISSTGTVVVNAFRINSNTEKCLLTVNFPHSICVQVVFLYNPTFSLIGKK